MCSGIGVGLLQLFWPQVCCKIMSGGSPASVCTSLGRTRTIHSCAGASLSQRCLLLQHQGHLPTPWHRNSVWNSMWSLEISFHWPSAMALSHAFSLSSWNLHQDAAAPEVLEGSKLDEILQEALRIITPSKWDVSLCVEMKIMFCLLGPAEKDMSLSETSPASLKL